MTFKEYTDETRRLLQEHASRDGQRAAVWWRGIMAQPERFPKTLYVTKFKNHEDEMLYTGFDAYEVISLDDHAGDVIGVYKLVEVKVLKVERSLG